MSHMHTGFTLHPKPFKMLTTKTIKHQKTLCVHMRPLWMHLVQPQPSNSALYAPLSSSVSSHISTYRLLCLVSAFQRSAMKPYTCAIMTSESLGDEFTSVTWNSAHVWQAKSSVKESTIQVSCFFSNALWQTVELLTKNEIKLQQTLLSF